jgi:hypothetical protein
MSDIQAIIRQESLKLEMISLDLYRLDLSTARHLLEKLESIVEVKLEETNDLTTYFSKFLYYTC